MQPTPKINISRSQAIAITQKVIENYTPNPHYTPEQIASWANVHQCEFCKAANFNCDQCVLLVHTQNGFTRCANYGPPIPKSYRKAQKARARARRKFHQEETIPTIIAAPDDYFTPEPEGEGNTTHKQHLHNSVST